MSHVSSISPIRRRIACGVAFLALVGTTAASATQSHTPQRGRSPLIFPANETKPKISSGQTYTITDDGAPSTKTYPFNGPTGFNNTGQIYGYGRANIASTGQYIQECLAFTGTGFINVAPSRTIDRCQIDSIADLASNETVSMVGALTNQADPDASAFLATYSASPATTTLKEFTSNPDSELRAINNSGDAFGVSYNAYFTGTTHAESNSAPYGYSASTGLFSPVKPACVKPGSAASEGCLLPPDVVQCPFGGCSFNAADADVSYDDNAHFLIYTPSSDTTQKISTQLVDQQGNHYDFNLNEQLSNYGLVDSANEYDKNSNVIQVLTGIVPAGATTWTWLPVLHDSCTYHAMLSANNEGEVLGTESSCTSAADAGYWTWDRTNGVQRVIMPAGTMYASASLLGVNDNGQLLAQLNVAKTDAQHWGTFDPVSSSIRRTTKPGRAGRSTAAH